MPADILLLIPSRLDLKGALDVSAQIAELPEADGYIFDFSKLEFLEPFGMLFFSSQLRRFRQHHLNCRFKAVHYRKQSYAAHMGFFQAFGLNYGKEPGEAPGSLQYVPITCLDLNELRKDAFKNYEDARETIE